MPTCIWRISGTVPTPDLDRRLIDGFCGVEIMRRLIGVAQLPLSCEAGEKRRLLELSRRTGGGLMIRLLCLFSLCLLAQAATGPDHAIWDALVRAYVTPEAFVNYKDLKAKSRPELDHYLATVAAKWPASMTQSGRKAALINAYNALMVRWVLDNYPVESVWKTKHPFTEARHTVNGRKMSLDDVETTLRDMGDPRIHAAIVCASRGCPPLRREAYLESRIEAQLDDSTRSWLANPGEISFFRTAGSPRSTRSSSGTEVISRKTAVACCRF